MSKNLIQQLQKDIKKVTNNLQKERRKVEKKAAKKIRDEAAYLARMLNNEPKRAKAQNPDKIRSGGANYVSLNTENMVWLPDPDGGEPKTDGTTVKEFLKKTKADKTMEKGKFRTQHYQGKYKKIGKREFARNAAGGRIWETKTMLGYYEKESKRQSQKEKDYIAKIKSEERKLRRKLKSQDSKKLWKLQRDVRRLEREANRKVPRKGAAVRLSRKREAYLNKKEKLHKQRQLKIQQKRMQRHYRIVGEIQKPRERTFLRMTRPNEVRTWYGDGGPEKYLGRKWKVTKVSELKLEVSIHPLDADERFLRDIESGGTFKPKPVLNGYTVFFEDTGSKGQQWSQRRIRFTPHVEDSKTARVRPRRFVKQTIERFRQLQKTNNFS